MANDVWQSAVLGDLFPGVQSRVDELKLKLNKALKEAESITASFNLKASAAVSSLAVTESVADQVIASGFYALKLEPAHGSIQQRINNADNPPPYVADPYSCGIVIMFQGLDIKTTAERYQSLIKIITSPI